MMIHGVRIAVLVVIIDSAWVDELVCHVNFDFAL